MTAPGARDLSGAGSSASIAANVETFPLEGGLSTAMAVGLALVLVIEGVVIHLWIAARGQVWAWALTAMNVLTLVWLWREHAASARSVMCVSVDTIDITVGRRLRCHGARALASAAVAGWQDVPAPAPDYVNAAKPLDPNVVIRFTEPVEVVLPLGIRRRIARIGVRVADPQRLAARLNGAG